MSDLICRKTMMRCQTPGMCSPYGGCQLQPVTESVFKAGHAALIEQAKSAPAEPDVERPISIPTALILWAGIEDQSQPTQWHKGYEAARGYVNMQICSAIPTTKDHLAVAEPVSREAVELVRSKFPRIDPCQPVPLDEKAHCCEYTIYVERERLHRIIDAKLAKSEGVKP